MTDLWARAESILTLEHDTVPHEDSLAEMEACPKPWCAYAYAGGGSGGAGYATYAALGCSKITSTLIRATSQCFSTWGTEKDQGNTPRWWGVCDYRLSWCAALCTDIRPHRHYPDVRHRVDSDYLTIEECAAASQETNRPEPAGALAGPMKPMVQKERSFAENIARLNELWESVDRLTYRRPAPKLQGIGSEELRRMFLGR
jgi:hypothetical protein